MVVAAVIAIGFKSTIAQAYSIPSGSMEPQLQIGDRVLVSRLAYRLHEPRRGDIVVFDDPTADTAVDDSMLPVRILRHAAEGLGVATPPGSILIKRVVALPGERVEGRDGAVWVDGRRLVEPYLSDDVRQGDFGVVVVPPGHVFVMGDHRDNSTDSRRFGPVPVGSVVGRAVAVVWPPAHMAHL